jgi:pyruvate dehydrogenase E2 component (dihydrolipoamide acetyltransferase)
MLKEVLLGKIGLTMESGTIVSWLKNEDDYVEKGEPLFEVETDKATQVIESFHSGYLRKILVPAGQEVPVRTVIAYIGEKDDAVKEIPAPKLGAAREVGTASGLQAQTPVGRGNSRVNASPLAKRLAAELSVDLSCVKGTGPDGRIGKEDVIAAKERPGEVQTQGGAQVNERAISPIQIASREKLSGIRKVVAERMTASYTAAPHIHLELFIDMTEAVKLREQMNRNSSPGVHLTYSDILMWASARTLRKHLHLNATFHRGTITIYDEINIGFAVAMERGLVVPVVRNADGLELADIAKRREELVARTKAGRQTTDDLAGGTFTITNLGMLGIVSFKPILNTGQAATLAVGQMKKTPVSDEEGEVQVRPIANLSLACDHRIVDGAEGARFLADLKNLLEDSEKLSS